MVLIEYAGPLLLNPSCFHFSICRWMFVCTPLTLYSSSVMHHWIAWWFFFGFIFLHILFLFTYLLQTYIYFLTHAEISSVSICIFYFVDGFICDFSVDHSCLCFIMVKASNPFSDCCFPLDTILFVNFLSVVSGGLILSLICHPHMHPYGTFLNSMHHHHSNSTHKIKN